MYRRADALEAGGYDLGFAPVWFDDIDLCMAIRRGGRKVFYLPDVEVLHHIEGRHGPRPRRPFLTRVRGAVRRRLDPDSVFTPEQRARCRHHYGYWRQKWGWDPLNPDLDAIARRWGGTEVAWALDPERRAAGEAILASWAPRLRARAPRPATDRSVPAAA
jgi:hypothetical protein